MAFKDKPYALAVIGLVLAVLTLGTAWLVAGRGKTLPPAVNGPALTPEQEALRQSQGESTLGSNQGAASQDVGDTGGQPVGR
jgi:hypothetical protein